MSEAMKLALLKIALPCSIIATIGAVKIISDSLEANRKEEVRKTLAAEKLMQDVVFYDLSKRFYAENPHLNPNQ